MIFTEQYSVCMELTWSSKEQLRCSGLVDQHLAVGDGLTSGFESQWVSICPCGDGLANGFKSRWVSICPSGDGLTNGLESRWVSICPL